MREWLEFGNIAVDEVCIDPSDYDGGSGSGSYLAHVMEKDDLASSPAHGRAASPAIPEAVQQSNTATP
jgi:hypothetical protein